MAEKLILKHVDHEKFHHLTDINRSVNPLHASKMKNSIQKYGQLRPVLVARLDFIGTRTLDYIVDGQHLMSALVQLGMDVEYERITGIKNYQQLVELISTLNTTSKSWTLFDYVNVWAATKKRSYIKLIEYQKEFKLPYSTLCMALNTDDMHKITSRMKEGKFSIREEDWARGLIKRIKNVLEIIKSSRSEQRVLIQSYIRFYKSKGSTYSHTKFLTGLQTHKSRVIVNLRNMKMCSDILEQVYAQSGARALTIVGKEGLSKAN